jgi:transcriptional regulator with XRE-family HTH domain
MTAEQVDMEKVRRVLRNAVKPAGKDSQRGLAHKAGLDRDAVYDLLQGRNRNPSLNVLAALAGAMGKDLSVFGVGRRASLPSAEELHAVLLDLLPEMPRGSVERRASFLSEAIAAALRLPPVSKASRRAAPRPSAPARKAAAPPRAPTRRG